MSMIPPTTHTSRQSGAVVMTTRALIVFDTVTLLLFALLHANGPLALGSAVLAEPRIIPAAIVEGLAGLIFAVSAYAVFTRASWAWAATVAAHVFTLAGVLLGITMIAAGFGPHSALNDTYHPLMVALLVVGLILLATPDVRAGLGSGPRPTSSGGAS
jgi:hypothetical protein